MPLTVRDLMMRKPYSVRAADLGGLPVVAPWEPVADVLGRIKTGRIAVLSGEKLVGLTSVADLQAGLRAERMTAWFE